VAVPTSINPTGRSAAPVDILNKEVQEWSEIWLRHPTAGMPWREGVGQPVGDPLPEITPQMLKAAAALFPARKGYSGFCARWFMHLDDEVLAGVCRLLMACERLGVWPATLQHAMLHLIPKKDQGKRPIGLIDGLCRLWELVRRPLVRVWRAGLTSERPYDYGGRGRKATDAVWLQALHDEAALANGKEASTLLLDLTKAFESVPLEHIWERGIALGFPLGVLRLSLEMCAFSRHLTLYGVVADGVDSVSAILAGTSFATDLLFAVFTGPCDRVLEIWPSLNLSLVVDDLAIQGVDERRALSDTIGEASDMVIQELTAIGCIVSKGSEWNPGERPW